MDIQRVRNLTTGRVHTEMGDIYHDLGWIVGDNGLMTHMLPRVLVAVEPWLRKNVADQRFWDGEYDPTHIGDIELPEPTTEEREEMFALSVLDAIQADRRNEAMASRWRDQIDGYPPQIKALCLMIALQIGLEWIDANCPQAFYRPLFEEDAR